ncbi:hypothetical protein N8616_01355 [Verrucomicrobia bacterium]|nr:hypothetical protein [Verrucomicrobiota bacterium]
MKSKNTTTTQIPAAEWNFSKIPPKDYSVVWEYEQFREIIKCRQNGDSLTEDLNAVCCVLASRDLTYLKYGKRTLPWNDVPEDFREVVRDHYAPFASSKRLGDSAKALLDSPLVHLGAYTDIDIKLMYDRVRATASDPRSSIHVFEIRFLEGVDSKKTIVKTFEEWLDNQDFTSAFLLSELRDLPSLAKKLKDPYRAFDKWLASKLSPETKEALKDYRVEVSDPDLLKQSLLQDLNTIIRSDSVFDNSRFVGVSLRKKVGKLAANYPPESDLERLNRMLIEDAFPQEVAKLKTAGRSVDLFAKLMDLSVYRLSRKHSDEEVADIISATYSERPYFSPEKVNRAKRNTVKCLVASVENFKGDNQWEILKATKYFTQIKELFVKMAEGTPLDTDDPYLPFLLSDISRVLKKLEARYDSAQETASDSKP